LIIALRNFYRLQPITSTVECGTARLVAYRCDAVEPCVKRPPDSGSKNPLSSINCASR